MERYKADRAGEMATFMAVAHAGSLTQAAKQMNPMGIDMLESYDISNALVFLASDEARYITGVTLPVDAGTMVQ